MHMLHSQLPLVWKMWPKAKKWNLLLKTALVEGLLLDIRSWNKKNDCVFLGFLA